jgi:hypothetical protein
MALFIVETSFTGKHVTMRLADDEDAEKSSETIDLRIARSSPLGIPTGSGDIPLGDIHTRQLATIQLAVLRYVRDAIGEETQRLSGLSRA